MNLHWVRGCLVLLLMVAATSTAHAQRFLDWPLRTTAEPEAATRGAEAVFWNPAGISTGATRAEFIVADQRTPDIIGIGGFAGAGAWRLDARTTLAAGFQHIAIDDIGETSTSPLADPGAPAFSITEDQLAVGVSHALGPAVTAGAGVRYDRSDETGLAESTTALGAGFMVAPDLAGRPAAGFNILTHNGGVRYSAAAVIGKTVIQYLGVRFGYGVRGGDEMATEHRVGGTIDWRGVLAVTGGVATSRAGSERSWEPVVGASLRVSRYELGLIRETLANSFGSAYSFRMRLGLK